MFYLNEIVIVEPSTQWKFESCRFEGCGSSYSDTTKRKRQLADIELNYQLSVGRQ